MIRRPPRSTLDRSSAASDVYKRQGLLRKSSEPVVDAGDVNGGGVEDGELVVPGGERAMVLEVVEPGLDGVAVLVPLLSPIHLSRCRRALSGRSRWAPGHLKKKKCRKDEMSRVLYTTQSHVIIVTS